MCRPLWTLYRDARTGAASLENRPRQPCPGYGPLTPADHSHNTLRCATARTNYLEPFECPATLPPERNTR